MASKKGVKPSVEKQEIKGRSIQIRSLEGREDLWIDGVRRKFHQTERGYTLYDDAYSPPQKSLIHAVKAYLEKTGGEGQIE